MRVLAREGPGALLVCGTNAYSPRCRRYALDAAGEYESLEELGGGFLVRSVQPADQPSMHKLLQMTVKLRLGHYCE